MCVCYASQAFTNKSKRPIKIACDPPVDVHTDFFKLACDAIHVAHDAICLARKAIPVACDANRVACKGGNLHLSGTVQQPDGVESKAIFIIIATLTLTH